MRLRKCRKCKTMPILKSEMVYVQEPSRLSESLKIPEPKLSYYYECECKSTPFCPTEEDAFKAWKHKYTFEKTETRYAKILKELER